MSAATAGVLFLPLLTSAALVGATGHMVLGVGPGFHVADLPAGTEVKAQMLRVGAVQVTAPLAALPALLRTPHVRGVWPDFALRTTSDDHSGGEGVLAPDAVGGAAGRANAGQGITVAVVDTGVADSATLNRSGGHLLRGPDFSGDTGSARDGFGHGTFMANLIAGGASNGDVIGIAPAATVVDVKVASSDGSTRLSRVLKGLDWVANNGAARGIDVLSLSLGADRPTAGYGSDPLTDATDAVQAAGVTVVVAAGNDASQVTDPGQDPQLFTVGAADTSGDSSKVASFSGRATVAGVVRPDLVAPGVRMLSVLPSGSVIATANPDSRTGGLWRGSGTSQATAVTAGAVAIFLSGRGKVDPQDVRASFAAVARNVRGSGGGAGLLVVPTKLRQGTYTSTSPATSGGSDPSTTSTSWSSTSWSSTSWSSTSWSSTSWSSTSWSSTSWSASSWA
jgi:serine protease AprX